MHLCVDALHVLTLLNGALHFKMPEEVTIDLVRGSLIKHSHWQFQFDIESFLRMSKQGGGIETCY